jgi:SAM-dependent methyltransferase
MNNGFVDRFAPMAADYADYRPRYPKTLFDWLAGLSPGRTLAWDCATGTGQAAVGLAALFERVIATDASAAQISQATPHPRIEYRVVAAESSGLHEHSADIITVAQALHWFDRDRFFAEVRRVLKPGGLLAVWTYGALRIDDADINALLTRFQDEIVGPCWPPERALVDSGYRSIELPFPALTALPAFAMSAAWTLPELLGYLGTWTATRRYREQSDQDPLELIHAALQAAWGAPDAARLITWPLTVRVARKPA